MITICGIDPGVTTGLATLFLDSQGARVFRVSSSTILSAMDSILKITEKNRSFVVLEDARLRTWFGHTGPERWQGAGSIKRDCQIWEEFLQIHEIPFLLIPPMHNKTKMTSAEMAKYTGINRSNQHERDAAALLLPYNYKIALATHEAKKGK